MPISFRPPLPFASHFFPPFSAGSPHACPICGVSYTHRGSLIEHMKKPSGKTTCPICQQMSATVNHLRRHMRNVHSMSREEVDRITNKRFYPTRGDYALLFGETGIVGNREDSALPTGQHSEH